MRRIAHIVLAALLALAQPCAAQAAFTPPPVPQGSWQAYTPTVSAGSGTLTTASATGAYQMIGKTLFFRVKATITTNGTGSNSVRVTLPNNYAVVDIQPVLGKEIGNSYKPVYGNTTAGAGFVDIYNLDSTYPAASGSVLYISGSVEVQ